MFRSLTTLYIFTLSKTVPMWREKKFFTEKPNIRKECVKVTQKMLHSEAQYKRD